MKIKEGNNMITNNEDIQNKNSLSSKKIFNLKKIKIKNKIKKKIVKNNKNKENNDNINELEVSKKKLNKYTKRRRIRSIKRLRFKWIKLWGCIKKR